ncbi:MAG: hypothetical protein ABSF26_05075 [Thermoguttaceae bacterium]|jgi:hypothetical protein
MFRALLMLACLVAIPVAALCGSSLPAIVKAFQEGRWPTLAELKGSPGPQGSLAGEPARFMPFAPQTAGPDPMPAQQLAGPAGQAEQPALATHRLAGGPEQLPSTVVAAGYEASIDPGKAAQAGSAGTPPGGLGVSVRSGQALSPVPPGEASLMPLDRGDGSAVAGSSAASSALPGVPAGKEPFGYVQERLRQLGATYYLLESWGDQKREFRFYCRMAIGGNSQYTRSFWAIDNDPLRAMGQVLQQVETWRQGRI